VNRCRLLIYGMVLLTASQVSPAQRHGYGTRGAEHDRTPPPPAGSRPEDLSDFSRIVALQATPDQAAEFERLSQSTQIARENAQSLIRLAPTAAPGDLFHSADLLTAMVDEAEGENRHFLKTLSPPQKSGLKGNTRKLTRAAADLTRQNKALAKHLQRSILDSKYIAMLSEKLENALRDLEAGQLALANEMGISPQETSP
jgi:hypothetical protein